MNEVIGNAKQLNQENVAKPLLQAQFIIDLEKIRQQRKSDPQSQVLAAHKGGLMRRQTDKEDNLLQMYMQWTVNVSPLCQMHKLPC